MIQYKTETIKKEFESNQLDKRLKLLIFMIVGLLENEHDCQAKITSVYRSDTEQKQLYGGKMPPFGNVHGQWRAVDLVAYHNGSLIPTAVGKDIRDCLNQRIQHDKENRYPTVVYHNIGYGWHFHVQVSFKDETKLKKEA